jgi:hypothetical protein
MAITISNTSEVLNRFCAKFDTEIHSQLRRDMVTESVWTPVTADYAYVSPQMTTTGEIVQAFQCPWTPESGTSNLTDLTWKLQPLKIDLEFTCDDLNIWFDKFNCSRTEWGSGQPLTAWDFPRYFLNEAIMPLLKDNMEMKIAYKGVHVAPTSGVAGTALGAVDGMGAVIADAITALTIPSANVITTGAITVANAVTKFELFVDGLPELARQQGGVIYCSEQLQRFFVRDMYERYGQGCCETTPIGNPDLAMRIKGTPVFNSNIRVVGLPSMAGSGRIIFSSLKDNLIWGRRTGQPQLPIIRWQEDKRTLIGLAEFHRFYGFRSGMHLFVNDQA